MKKIITISVLTLISMLTTVSAQKFKALNKVQKAIVSVNTYDNKGELLHSGTGFYVGQNGEAIADYSVFKGAYKAIVIDMSGKQAEVDCILGADDTYSVVRFKVKTKGNASLTVASDRALEGETVFSVPYSKEKLKGCRSTTVESASPIQEKYSYYTLDSNIDSINIGSPIFNEKGEVIGILQTPFKNKGYALDVRYKDELVIKAIASTNTNMALNSINIAKGLPESVEEALVYTYFKSRSAGNVEYLDIMNRFVDAFPNNPEGYIRRCTPLIDMLKFDEADADLNKYLSISDNKANAHYSVAQTVLNKLTYIPTPEYEKWSYDYAIGHVDNSIRLYTEKNDTAKITEAKILKAQILSGKKDYDSAIAVYDELLKKEESKSPAIYYAKSMVCEQRGDSLNAIIENMDSAIASFPTPLPREASNYILRRGQLYAKAKQNRKAVMDYNQYCYLVNNQVNDVFYYDRCQIEMEARMFQQAYDDINSAISMKPNNLDYKVEKAGMCLRFNYIDECISLCNEVLAVLPEDTTALRILGYAQIQKGDKDNAVKSLKKAIDLGDGMAKEIMEKYAK